MKCICGYEYKKPKNSWDMDIEKGEVKFKEYDVLSIDEDNKHFELRILICPKCKTIKGFY